METTSAKTYRIRFLDGNEEAQRIDLDSLKARLCFRPEDGEKAFWQRLEQYGVATLRGTEFMESPYICRGCNKTEVTDDNEEECPACLAIPRCKSCSAKIEDGSSAVICSDCAARCSDCHGTFSAEYPRIVLETKNDAHALHARCCGKIAFSIVDDPAWSSEYRDLAADALEKYLAAIREDIRRSA